MFTFAVECAWVFGLTALTDFIWAKYMTTAADGKALAASLWSAAIIGVGSFVVTAYVQDHRLIMPAMIGAFVGTYFSLRFEKRGK